MLSVGALLESPRARAGHCIGGRRFDAVWLLLRAVLMMLRTFQERLRAGGAAWRTGKVVFFGVFRGDSLMRSALRSGERAWPRSFLIAAARLRDGEGA